MNGWEERVPKNVPELLGLALSPTDAEAFAFRGHPRRFPLLLPSKWRDGENQTRPRLTEDSYREFYLRTHQYMSREESGIIQPDLLQLLAPDETSQPSLRINGLTLLQHYGFATELLDWTSDGLVALFFAAASDLKHDGEIWWFEQGSFMVLMTEQWKSLGFADPRDVTLDKLRADHGAETWITQAHNTLPFARLRVQRGFFTISRPQRIAHDVQLNDLEARFRFRLPRGRIIVPQSMKVSVLNRLRDRGIDATHLQLPWADNVVNELRVTTGA